LATKWTGLGFWLLLFLFWAVFYFSGSRRPLWQQHRLPFGLPLLAFGIIPLGIYLASFLANQRDTSFWVYLWDWHKQAWNFHHTLHATHPYESEWWSWLYLGRPVWYFFKESDGVVRGILALGNPLLWWFGIPALLASSWTIFRRKTPELLFPLAGALAFYLPWIVIGRTSFQYYTVPIVPFYFILLAFWANHLWHKPRWRLIIETLLVLAVRLFLFFLPLLIGYPVSNDFYRLHLWFPSWI
jgi:dolichyl-phosphate-mannose--protein O-mannosyl transferase